MAGLVDELRQSGRRGETAAAQLYRDFWPRLFRHFMLNRLSEADAEELANQVLLKVIRNIHQLSEPDALRAWIWKIAGNELIGHWRSHVRQMHSEVQLEPDAWDALHDSLPDQGVFDLLTMHCLEKQLAAFTRDQPERAAALELALLEDLSLADVAQTLARTSHATTEFLHQCRKKLWQYLSHCLD